MKAKETYSEEELVLFLVGAICLFFIVFLFFLLATFIKRSIKLRTQRKSEDYQKIADELLFNALFGNTTLEQSLQQFNSIEHDPLLKRTMTRSIISLHRNYSGEQRKLLENFFVLSDLADYSYKKVKSSQWVNIVEGIRVLSVLNVHEAFTVIRMLLTHPSDYVKKEAFIGLITLKGLKGLEEFPLPQIVIDDWTQSCILYQLKIRHFNSFEGIQHLFGSENDTLVLLGARIADYFQLHEYYEFIVDFRRELQPKYQSSFDSIRDRISKNIHP
jgi:hypothetical protein